MGNLVDTIPLLGAGLASPGPGDGFGFALRESTLSGMVVCACLLVLSCFSWAVMITKLRVILRTRKQSRQFLRLFRSSSSPMHIYAEGHAFQGSPHFAVYLAGCRETAFQLLGSTEVDATFQTRLDRAGKLSPDQVASVEAAMERSVGESVLRLESQMTLLATTVSGAPFLGLLGTVWGVMDTFGGVAAAEGAASLKTMAPGVSAALVTTVVGLLVAIPAMFGYNFLVNSIRKVVAELDNFSGELAGHIRRCHASLGRRQPIEASPEPSPTPPARPQPQPAAAEPAPPQRRSAPPGDAIAGASPDDPALVPAP